MVGEDQSAAGVAAASGSGHPGSDRWSSGLAALYRFEDKLSIVLFVALVVLALTQVVVRFLLYEWLQIAWADEIGRALLVWTSFWGAVIVQREDNHIMVELLYVRLSRHAQWVLRIFSDVVVAAFLLYLAWQARDIFTDSFRRSAAASGLPTAIFDAPLWIACWLMVFHMAVNAVRRWQPPRERIVPRSPAPGGVA